MCECIQKVNEQLAKDNARLATRMSLNLKTGKEGIVLPLPVEKINSKARKSLPVLFPRYCAFCGEKRVPA